MLQLDRLKTILDYDPNTGVFIWRTVRAGTLIGSKAGSLDKDGYVVICVDGKLYKAHRLAFFYMTGNWPAEHIDHRDLDKSNNVFENLREATNSENKINMELQANSTSGYRGVCFKKSTGKWFAHIKLNGKKKHLGYFDKIEDAVEAYRKASGFYHNSEFRRSA